MRPVIYSKWQTTADHHSLADRVPQLEFNNIETSNGELGAGLGVIRSLKDQVEARNCFLNIAKGQARKTLNSVPDLWQLVEAVT